jgi:hypothetical protein
MDGFLGLSSANTKYLSAPHDHPTPRPGIGGLDSQRGHSTPTFAWVALREPDRSNVGDVTERFWFGPDEFRDFTTIRNFDKCVFGVMK